MRNEVLVLNSDYEPLNICNIRRAMLLVFLGKVDVLHEDSVILHTVSAHYRSPSVVRLKSHIKRPQPQLKLSRRSILARDNYTCQILRPPRPRPDGRSRGPTQSRRAIHMGQPGLLLQEVQHSKRRQDPRTDRIHPQTSAQKTEIRAVHQPHQVYDRCKQSGLARLPAHFPR